MSEIKCRACGAPDHPSGCAGDFRAGNLHVTSEYFDYLAADRPAKADPRLVALFRSMRGKLRHD